MKELPSLDDFLTRGAGRYQVFDMGRRVIPIPVQSFRAFESFTIPYPYPLQQQSWIGLLGWQGEDTTEQYIWFLRFPLDELGCLVPAARQDFMYRLMEQLGASRQPVGEADPMADSPYGFRPQQNRMAVFHAKALRHLGLAPSRFYAATRDYLSGTAGYDQWRFLGIQGLADVSARWDLEDNQDLLRRALPQLPETPWGVLCECLENEALDDVLVDVIAARLRHELQQPQPRVGLVAAGVRALSHAPDAATRKALEQEILSGPLADHIEVLAAMAGRCWEDLVDAEIAGPYLEALARSDSGDAGFQAILADLMFLPGMREPLLKILRRGEASEPLAKRLAGFFGNTAGQHHL